MNGEIDLFYEDIDFVLPKADSVKNWVRFLIRHHGSLPGYVNYIFCGDAYLLDMNREYLQHDYYTDILTFPTEGEQPDALNTDIYISVDRVLDNAELHRVPFEDELHRVMAHGILHMLGYADHSEEDAANMRSLEDQALSMRNF